MHKRGKICPKYAQNQQKWGSDSQNRYIFVNIDNLNRWICLQWSPGPEVMYSKAYIFEAQIVQKVIVDKCGEKLDYPDQTGKGGTTITGKTG
jgi:hypothetical protein